MAAAAYALEKHVAIAAVSRACGLTASVFKKLVNTETVIKGDKSPVTGECALVENEPLESH